ncbi:hypothetical protein [Salimicrobium flavidum]|uniref:hypothetical protein n=1 Tax=Salimicrobium flavidum TaxID=570947 RepID=UPI00117A0CBA|nr:hypothetical protein [Salimicrobium flavidum]
MSRGKKARSIAEEEGVAWDPEKGKELLLVHFETYLFEAEEASIDDYASSIMEVNPEKAGRSPGYELSESKEVLSKGETGKHQVIYEIDESAEEVNGLIDTAVNGELWFNLQ